MNPTDASRVDAHSEADANADDAVASPAYTAAWSDRIVIGFLCFPTTYALGWTLLRLLTHGITPNPDGFSRFVGFIIIEMVLAIFLVSLCGSLWAVTGSRRFRDLTQKHFGKMILVILLSAAVLFIVSSMLR